MTYSYKDFRSMLSDVDFSGLDSEALVNYRQNVQKAKDKIDNNYKTMAKINGGRKGDFPGVTVIRRYSIPAIENLTDEEVDDLRIVMRNKLHAENPSEVGRAMTSQTHFVITPGSSDNVVSVTGIPMSDLHTVIGQDGITPEAQDIFKQVDRELGVNVLITDSGSQLLTSGERFNEYDTFISQDDLQKELKFQADQVSKVMEGIDDPSDLIKADFGGIREEAIESYCENVGYQKSIFDKRKKTIDEDSYDAPGIEFYREYYIPEIDDLKTKKDFELFRNAIIKKLRQDNPDVIGQAVAWEAAIDFQQGEETNLLMGANLSISQMHDIDFNHGMSPEFVEEIQKLDADMNFNVLENNGCDIFAFGPRYDKYSDFISDDDLKNEKKIDLENRAALKQSIMTAHMFDGLEARNKEL